MMLPLQTRSAARAAVAAAAAVTLGALVSTPLAAQSRFVGRTTTAHISPAFETWSFSTPIVQPRAAGSGTIQLDGVRQIALPVLVDISFNERWAADVSTAFVSGNVSLAAADGSGKTSYSVNGLTDTKLRLTGRLRGDNVVVTLGVNAPTGSTELEPEALDALRVVAAPALGFQIPVLGTGGGGTAGLVLARQTNNFALAFGASYEIRRGYAPVVLAAGIAAPDFNPGDIFHVSVGADGVVGEHGLSASVSTDFFSEDELVTSGSSATPTTTHLGPIVTIEARLRVATTKFRELSVFLMDRYRTKYEVDGEAKENSSGNYLDAGVLGVNRLGANMDLAWEISARHHTGLKSDDAIATAAMSGFGARIGVARQLQSGVLLQPFLQLRKANIKNADLSSSATGFSLGLTISKRL